MKTVRLGDVAEVNPRVTAELKAQPDQEIAFLPMDAVGEDGSVRYQERRLASSVLTGYTLFKKGDVLLAKITPCMENGKATYLDGLATEFGAGSTEFHVLRPGPDLDGRFLFYLIWNPAFRTKAEGRMTGSAGQKRVPADFLKDLSFKCPPLDEQRRIAAILDKADAIRRKRQQAVALADDFLRSAFLEMFGDPATNPKGFDVVPTHNVLSKDRPGTQSGPFGSALKKHEYVPQGIPVWGIDSVQANQFVPETSLFISDEKFQQLVRYRVYPGDILISRAGTVGRMCIAAPNVEKSIISTNLVRVCLDKKSILPSYFVSLFTYAGHRLGGLRSNQKENAFTFLNPGTLKALEIPVPPLTLQQNFHDLVQRVRKADLNHVSSLASADNLFASLSQRAFQGGLQLAAVNQKFSGPPRSCKLKE